MRLTQIGGAVARKLKGEMQTSFTESAVGYTVGLQVTDPFLGYVYENEEYFADPQQVPFETKYFPDELASHKWKKQKKWATKRSVEQVKEQVNNLHTKRDAIEWRSGLRVTDELQLYVHDGIEYLPDSGAVPFTTSGSFESDLELNKFSKDNIKTVSDTDKIYTRSFRSIVDLKSGVSADGEVVNFNDMIGNRVEWRGYYEEFDGGSNWGVVKEGAHTEDGGSVFHLIDNIYVKSNLKGIINVRKFGASKNISNNTPIIHKVMNYAGLRNKAVEFTDLLPITETMRITHQGINIIGRGAGQWSNYTDTLEGSGVINNSTKDAVVVATNSVNISNFRIAGNSSSGNGLNLVEGSTLFTGKDLIIVGHGKNGVAFTGLGAGESGQLERIESSRNKLHGFYLSTGFSMNNTVFFKINAHRNGRDGMNINQFISNVTIGGGSDFTLNRYGINWDTGAYSTKNNRIEKCWFENNENAIRVNMHKDSYFISKNNTFRESGYSVNLISGAIHSYSDEHNRITNDCYFFHESNINGNANTVISDLTYEHLEGVPFGGSNNMFKYIPRGKISTYKFVITNPTSGTVYKRLNLTSGGSLVRLNGNSRFYSMRAYLADVTGEVTAGAVTFQITRETTGNLLQELQCSLNVDNPIERYEIIPNGTLNFKVTEKANIGNFWVNCNTSSGWNGTGTYIVEVCTLDCY